MTAPIIKGSQPEREAAEQEKAARRVADERARWWRLGETARRCKQLAVQLWDADLQKAGEEQRATAETLRDRHTVGTRVTTGQAYEIDKGLMVPVLTPYDRLVFLEKVAVSYMIYAERQGLPVTVEGTKRETEKADGAGATAEAGSGVDETQSADEEVRALAETGELPGPWPSMERGR